MQYRHLFPMVRILLPFMAGIIVSVSTSAIFPIPALVWISLLAITLIAGFFTSNKWRFINLWVYGILMSCFLFVAGYNMVLLHKEILRPEHFSHIQNKGIFLAKVEEPLQEKNHSFKTILRVVGLKKGGSIVKADGLILTYFAKDSTEHPPAEGSLVVFTGDAQIISPPQNPGAFDYQKYMANNNVYHQVYLSSKSWRLLENPSGFNLFKTAHQVSGKFVSILRNSGLKGREFAVAAALIMGQSDMLDNETLQAYSGTGVMHILCVSGLHVGVIFIIISFVLGFMKNKGSQLYIKTVIILLTIWTYALLTGMSPSVMRSAVMFTFISVGNASNRYVHIINSLAISAFALLLYNPLMINNIGFQLSYLAIIGIVFINKPVAGLWEPKNRIMEYVWDLVAVSLAAQIATAPLAMFYFHQFPAYFIPANLVAIPLSFLAIYSGVAVLVFSFIPWVSHILGIITNYILFVLNYSVSFIEHLPNAVLHITSIFPKEAMLIYLIIISIILFFYYNRKGLVYLTLSLILLLSVCLSLTEITRQKQQKIIFYSTGKQSAIGFINGKEQIVIADSTLIRDKIACKFQLDGAKSLYGITNGSSLALDTIAIARQESQIDRHLLAGIGNNFLFHNKRIAIVDSIPKIQGHVKKLLVDYLWIRKNAKLRINDLLKSYQPGSVIIDGSNSFYKTEKWMTELKNAGIKAYSLKKSGAYIINL